MQLILIFLGTCALPRPPPSRHDSLNPSSSRSSSHGQTPHIERSLRTSTSSRLSRDTSVSRSLTGLELGSPLHRWPRQARKTQFANVLSDIASPLAASEIVNFCSKTSRTAALQIPPYTSVTGIAPSRPPDIRDNKLKASTFSSLAHPSGLLSLMDTVIAQKSYSGQSFFELGQPAYRKPVNYLAPRPPLSQP